jgi:hypothetical protein
MIRTRRRALSRRARVAAASAFATLAIAGVAAAAAPPASAATSGVIPNPITSLFGSCKTPPTPQLPGSGASGWFQQPPSAAPPAGSPFGPHATTTEYEQYGTAGLQFSTYDLGCLSNPVSNSSVELDTTIGNWLLGGAKVVVAIDGAVHTWASSSKWQDALYPLVTGATRVVHDALFTPWAAVTLLILGITLAFRAIRSDIAGVLAATAWMVAVLGLVGVATANPTWLPRQTSALMSYTLNALDAGFIGPGAQQAAASNHESLLTNTVLYSAWARGEFGSSTSQAARTYGPRLLQNEALSWSQAAASPQQIATTVKAEESRWSQAASSVQASDPQAYAYLQGTAGGRASTGLLALAAALITCTFDIFASLVVVLAMLSVLVAVVMLPGLAAVGIHDRMRYLITGLASRVAGLLLSGILYAAAAGLDTRATAALLGQPLHMTPAGATTPFVPLQLALLLLLLLPIVLWILVRKARGRRVVPRPIYYAASYLGLRRGLRRGTRRGAQVGTRAGLRDWYEGDRHLHLNFAMAGDGDEDDGWHTTATADPRPPDPAGGGGHAGVPAVHRPIGGHGQAGGWRTTATAWPPRPQPRAARPGLHGPQRPQLPPGPDSPPPPAGPDGSGSPGGRGSGPRPRPPAAPRAGRGTRPARPSGGHTGASSQQDGGSPRAAVIKRIYGPGELSSRYDNPPLYDGRRPQPRAPGRDDNI